MTPISDLVQKPEAKTLDRGKISKTAKPGQKRPRAACRGKEGLEAFSYGPPDRGAAITPSLYPFIIIYISSSSSIYIKKRKKMGESRGIGVRGKHIYLSATIPLSPPYFHEIPPHLSAQPPSRTLPPRYQCCAPCPEPPISPDCGWHGPLSACRR